VAFEKLKKLVPVGMRNDMSSYSKEFEKPIVALDGKREEKYF